DAVGFKDRLSWHAVFARNALESVAAADDDRRAAIPGPVTGGFRRRLLRDGARIFRRLSARPIGAETLRAAGHAGRHAVGPRRGRRRQSLRFDTMHRARRDRAGHVLRRAAAVGGVWVGVEAA